MNEELATVVSKSSRKRLSDRHLHSESTKELANLPKKGTSKRSRLFAETASVQYRAREEGPYHLDKLEMSENL